jgi:hypothetical protein
LSFFTGRPTKLKKALVRALGGPNASSLEEDEWSEFSSPMRIFIISDGRIKDRTSTIKLWDEHDGIHKLFAWGICKCLQKYLKRIKKKKLSQSHQIPLEKVFLLQEKTVNLIRGHPLQSLLSKPLKRIH